MSNWENPIITLCQIYHGVVINQPNSATLVMLRLAIFKYGCHSSLIPVHHSN